MRQGMKKIAKAKHHRALQIQEHTHEQEFQCTLHQKTDNLRLLLVHIFSETTTRWSLESVKQPVDQM